MTTCIACGKSFLLFHILVMSFFVPFSFWVAQDEDRASYYAIFDGHGGTDAAAYAVAHMHCEIAASRHYPEQPEEALREAFISLDNKFIEKSKKLVSAGGWCRNVMNIQRIWICIINELISLSQIEIGCGHNSAMCSPSSGRRSVVCCLGGWFKSNDGVRGSNSTDGHTAQTWIFGKQQNIHIEIERKLHSFIITIHQSQKKL